MAKQCPAIRGAGQGRIPTDGWRGEAGQTARGRPLSGGTMDELVMPSEAGVGPGGGEEGAGRGSRAMRGSSGGCLPAVIPA